ncbi:hypothetical protein FRB96_001280 [Tulasnella sp. 330]|nr:hypothetical protein FRB96_001280 [Tulasnella sp. 330]KAG8872533.1 hypothetical protein FRB98_009539 [Tulasnella sp. 332]
MATESFPKTIKAIGFNQNGDIDVIEELKDIPFPPVNDDDVIIKVEYAGVNFIDTYQRAGLYPSAKFPVILGIEASGTVVKLPASEKALHGLDLKVGDKVATLVNNSFAEYVALPAWRVAKLPATVDTRTGAAVILQGLTALTFARESYAIKKGDIILIYAAAGGVGNLLTAIALHFGATVIATVSTETKAEFVRYIGAQHVLITSTQSVVDEVLKITDGKGVHAIFDGIGKDTFEDNFKLVRRKGTIVSIGNASGVAPPLNILRLSEKNIKIVRPRTSGYVTTPEETKHYQDELLSLLVQGAFKVQRCQDYPFTAEGVQQSQKDITSRGTVGKLLINVAGL